MESNEGTPTTVLGDDQFFHAAVQMKTHGPVHPVSCQIPTPCPNMTMMLGDHTPDVDHGGVNVATQETKSETVTESSQHGIHDLHVKTDPEYELTCNVAILKSESMEGPKSSSASVGHVEKHVTMSKRRRQEFEGNIERLNLHDKVFEGMMGLREFPEPAEPHILVFTSRPLLFAHPTVRTIDVALMGIDLVVFAIRYDTGLDDYKEHPLKHAKLLTEVQSYCEASGARWMNMDYFDTRRWDHYDVQEPPIICSSAMGMTTNDKTIGLQITAWAEGTEPVHDPGKDYQDLFTYDIRFC